MATALFDSVEKFGDTFGRWPKSAKELLMRSANSMRDKFNGDVTSTRLPLRVRTVADVEVLLDNARWVRRLPREGVVVVLAGLDPHESRRLEERIRGYIRSCGCAEGGAAALSTAILAISFIAFQIWRDGPQWSELGVAAAGLVLTVLAAGIGKLAGLTLARLRFERCCRSVVEELRVERVLQPGMDFA
jgi:hypothetical protein